MLAGVERLVDLVGARESGLVGATLPEVEQAIQRVDLPVLENTDGHFAAVLREGQNVRMARTIGLPLRYFVAKMFHGPFLVVADRIDRIYDYCCSQKIGWQFDPLYTRMVPAHYLVEIQQIGCPDPSPIYHRFFNPAIGQGPADIEELGTKYLSAAYVSTLNWLRTLPSTEPVAVAFSGGVDSTSAFLLARKAMVELGRDPDLIRPFTLDLGGGKDAEQAEQSVRELGLAETWEVVRMEGTKPDLAEAISVIEDYHPLDVECAAAGLLLLRGIRERYPELKYALDGDGGDENLKAYPLEDSDLTISSVLRNPLLYQEGWGVEALKHSLTYSGGLSRAYVRTFAPGAKYGFEAFSPYTTRASIGASLRVPFEALIDNSAEKLYHLKAQVVQAGVKAVTGIEMPVFPKRRFQDGAGGESYRHWRVSKAWCRQVFLRQWEERLSQAWDPAAERQSGNVVPAGYRE
jgi:asparagine synthase (glutamine-hydrolysing)